MYNLDIDELINANHLPDASNIEAGQLIFIPQRKDTQGSYVGSSKEDFIWPLKGRVIASFGQKVNNTVNKGLDIQSRSPSEVIASRSGRVVFRSKGFAAYGKTIIIDHGDGFSTVYARNTELLVNLGDQVQKGEIIARVGSDQAKDTSYLHFEIRKVHIPQNPFFYLP